MSESGRDDVYRDFRICTSEPPRAALFTPILFSFPYIELALSNGVFFVSGAMFGFQFSNVQRLEIFSDRLSDERGTRCSQLLDRAIQANDVPAVRDVLQQLVSGYRPADEIVDWITVVGRA